MVFEIGSHHKVSMPCSCVCVSIDNQIIAIIHSIRIYFGMRLTLSTHILWGGHWGISSYKMVLVLTLTKNQNATGFGLGTKFCC